jgi:hypothetical protein
VASFVLVPSEIEPSGPPPPLSRGPVLAIVGANALTLVMAVALDWTLGSLLWPYWLQSLVIGFFSCARIMALRRFSTGGFKINDREVPTTPEGKLYTVGFFVLHYGFFHLIYAVFLLFMALPRLEDLPWFTVALAGFVLGHLRSFREHLARDLAGCPNIGVLTFLPYARIVPMHLVILAGAFWSERTSALAVAGFVVVKTAADVAMHVFEHRRLGEGGPGQRAG